MFKYPSVIIVNGHPATGKTTIARKLAEDLKVPVFHKDAIKETLFDQLGYGDRERSKQYGLATYAVIYKLLEDFLHSDFPCIIESNFNPEYDRQHFQKLAEKYDFKVVEVFCHCPAEQIIERFKKRISDGDRHPGHSDAEYLEEFSKKVQTPLLPLNLGGKVLRVDTTDFAKFDYDKLLQEVKFWTNVAYRKPFQLVGGAFGIIFNAKDEVLLCHRTDKDMWNLPGGGIEEHESPWDAALREVKEETGLNIEVNQLSGVYFRSSINEEKYDQISFTFLCTPLDGELTLNNEADIIQYFPVNALPENLVPRHAERIQDAFIKRQQSTYKEQN